MGSNYLGKKWSIFPFLHALKNFWDLIFAQTMVKIFNKTSTENPLFLNNWLLNTLVYQSESIAQEAW